MTSEIVTVNRVPERINWGTQNLVESKNIIIQTSGRSSGKSFAGMVLHIKRATAASFCVGYYSDEWDKEQFTLCPPETELRLRNSK